MEGSLFGRKEKPQEGRPEPEAIQEVRRSIRWRTERRDEAQAEVDRQNAELGKLNRHLALLEKHADEL